MVVRMELHEDGSMCHNEIVFSMIRFEITVGARIFIGTPPPRFETPDRHYTI
jgi:hypothetical protein